MKYNWKPFELVNYSEDTIELMIKNKISWSEPIMILIWETKKRVSIFITLNQICLDNDKI